MAASGREFIISRALDAPRELVYSAWTERAHLMRWWGPKGVTIVSCKNDLRVDGTMHYAMQMPEGDVLWGKWIYREIAKPERLVFINSFSNEAGGLTRHPLMPDWPAQTLSTITFAEDDGKTRLIVRWSPFEATDVERETFDAGHELMRHGWTGTLDKLTDYLSQLTREQKK